VVDLEVLAVNEFKSVVRDVEVDYSLGDVMLCQEIGSTETNVNKLLLEERYQLAGSKEGGNEEFGLGQSTGILDLTLVKLAAVAHEDFLEQSFIWKILAGSLPDLVAINQAGRLVVETGRF
jgi:hypothetical protein